MREHDDSVEVLRECPVCGGSVFLPMPTPGTRIGASFFGDKIDFFKLVKCRACRLEFVNPRPSCEVLARFYDMPGYPAHEALKNTLISVSRFNFISTLSPESTLLDYGCGGGTFLKKAQEERWLTVGIEPSAVGRKNAQDLGLEVYGNIRDLPAQKRFDVVTMFHVLEHVPDLCSVLLSIKNIMTKKGILIVEVPNIGSFRAMVYKYSVIRKRNDERYRAFPIHLYGFNKKTLNHLLREHGFCSVKETSFDFGWKIETIGQKNNIVNKTNATIEKKDNSSARGLSLREILKKVFFSLCLGERLIVAARQSSVCENTGI